jgi:mycothiol synthase
MAVWTIRAPRDEDFSRIAEIFRAQSREAGIEPTGTEASLRSAWSGPRFDITRHARVAEVDGEVVAAGRMHFEGTFTDASSYVLPEHRGEGIGTALLRYFLDTARAEPGINEFYTWASAAIPPAIALLEAFPGSGHERTFHRMLNASPAGTPEPAWPKGIALRALEGDELIGAMLEAHNASFIDHWNFHPITDEEIRHWLEQPTSDPSLWFIATAGDAVAGFCVCTVLEGDGFLRGDLGPIGTTRPFRRIGLGRALLRHGVRELAVRGAKEVTLGVDNQNPNQALRLYESEGFVHTHQGHVYRIQL